MLPESPPAPPSPPPSAPPPAAPPNGDGALPPWPALPAAPPNGAPPEPALGPPPVEPATPIAPPPDAPGVVSSPSVFCSLLRSIVPPQPTSSKSPNPTVPQRIFFRLMSISIGGCECRERAEQSACRPNFSARWPLARQ